MRPKGTVYQSGLSGTHGEIILFLPIFLRLIYHFFRLTGATIFSFAFLSLFFSFGPVIKQEISYNFGGNHQDYTTQFAEAKDILKVQQEASDYQVNSYFSVVIPKIGAASNIIANVDSGQKEEYLESLKKGVAHAKGTYFPGQEGRIFLFSHSTDSPMNFARYNAVFYLLGKLEPYDKIIIFFADKKYVYEVQKLVSADSTDTSWLVPNKLGEELILMTCDPPGTTWRRLLVISKPYKN